jgi:hypothetical protein
LPDGDVLALSHQALVDNASTLNDADAEHLLFRGRRAGSGLGWWSGGCLRRHGLVPLVN